MPLRPQSPLYILSRSHRLSARAVHLPPFLPSAPQPPEKEDYYSLLLLSPLPASPSSSRSLTQTATLKEESRVIFGSRLAGPAARQKEGWAQERPPEPDNCCMSGCVNCVWDAYREEVEEWAARRRKSEGIALRGGVDGNMEDLDGTRAEQVLQRELFEGVPVGIKEFMILEKRLREKEGEKE